MTLVVIMPGNSFAQMQVKSDKLHFVEAYFIIFQPICS